MAKSTKQPGNIEEYLSQCCEACEIDLGFVSSNQFYDLLMLSDWTKEPIFESLSYSRTYSMDIELGAALARPWVMDKRLFLQKADKTFWRAKFPIHLGTGFKQFEHMSKQNLLDMDRMRGTKYTALLQNERKGGKIEADIVATRSTFVDPIMAAIEYDRFLAWIYAVNDQLFLESDRPSSPMTAAVMTGFNFEELMTVKQAQVGRRIAFKWAKDNREKYNTLVRHSCLLKNASILVSCEVDAVRPDEMVDASNGPKTETANKKQFEDKNPSKSDERAQSTVQLTELKETEKSKNISPKASDSHDETKLTLDNPKENLGRYVEFKARVERNSHISNFKKALVQCYLAGTPTLVIGIKDGLKLTSIKEYSVPEVLSGRMRRMEPQFLDRWLIFLVRFMKACVAKLRKDGIQSFLFATEGSKIVIREIPRSRLEIEGALTAAFLEWREKNSQRDDLAGQMEALSIDGQAK